MTNAVMAYVVMAFGAYLLEQPPANLVMAYEVMAYHTISVTMEQL